MDPKGISTNKSSLLLLNDDCLTQLCKYLELMDLVNISKTCVRLKNIAAGTFDHRFDKISVNDSSADTYSKHYGSLKVTRRQFCDVLSVIGWRVRSIDICGGYDFVFRVVTSKCENVGSLTIKEYPKVLSLKTRPHLQKFKSLTELRIYKCTISKDAVRQIFSNNPNITHLESDIASKSFVKSLRLLPELDTLYFDFIHGLGVDRFPNLFHLTAVQHFKFRSSDNCNKFIHELATKWKLRSLHLCCVYDGKTFDLLKLFDNLRYLVMDHTQISSYLPDHTVFPPKLKFLSFDSIKFNLHKLVSIVHELRFLETIDLKTECLIGFDGDFDNNRRMLSVIVDALSPVLQLQERTLKLIFHDYDYWSNDGSKYFHNSKNLQIIGYSVETELKKYFEQRASEKIMLRVANFNE